MNVICQICRKEMNQINNCHLKKHNITTLEYRKMFPNSKIVSDEYSKRRSEIAIRMQKDNPHLAELAKVHTKIYNVSDLGRKKSSEIISKFNSNNPGLLSLNGKIKGRLNRIKYNKSFVGRSHIIKYNRSEEHRILARDLAYRRLDDPKDSFGGKFYRRLLYKGYSMRSSWEVEFAKKLDYYDLNWSYESTYFWYTYRNKVHRYTPDFYIEGIGFIEIKPLVMSDDILSFKLESVRTQGFTIYLINEYNWDMFFNLISLNSTKLLEVVNE